MQIIKNSKNSIIKELNLKLGGSLPIELIKILNAKEEQIRAKYNKYTDELLKLNNNVEFSWLNRSTVRNPYKSNLFIYFCYIELILEIISHNYKIEKIIVDNFSLYNSIKKIIKSKKLNTKIVRSTGFALEGEL